MFWGILSFLQISLLPGLIAARYLRLRTLLQTLTYAFALSQLINYLLVCFLVWLGIYTRPVVITCVVLETLWLAYLYHPFLKGDISILLGKEIQRIKEFCAAFSQNWVLLSCLVLAFLCIIVQLGEFYKNSASVFVFWDAIASWNPWAIDWSLGKLPQDSKYYPQLLSTNWSLSYVLMGNTQIQFYIKALTPLYILYIFLYLLDYALYYKRPSALLVLIFTYLFCHHILKAYSFLATADIPVAFFTFLCLHPLLFLKEQGKTRKELWRAFAFSGLLCVAAISTKRAGLFTVLPFLLLTYWNIRSRGMRKWKNISYMACLLSIIILGFILLNAVTHINSFDLISFDKDYVKSYLGVRGIHLDWSNIFVFTRDILSLVLQNLKSGVIQFDHYLGKMPKFIFALLIFVGSLGLPNFLLLSYIIPFCFVWAFLFSYDQRNLASLFPLFAVLMAEGTQRLASKAEKIYDRLLSRMGEKAGFLSIFVKGSLPSPRGSINLWHIIFILLIVVFHQHKYNRLGKLVGHQEREQIHVGRHPHLNQFLISYFELPGVKKEKILTNYPLINSVPKIKALELVVNLEIRQNNKELEKSIAKNKVGYVLLHPPSWDRQDPDYIRFIHFAHKEAYHPLLVDKDGMIFYKTSPL